MRKDQPIHADGPPQRIPSIDGLRAIAIMLVFVDHFLPFAASDGISPFKNAEEIAAWSGTGVDLFFVLSGFLITGILVDSKGSQDYFRRFYWRRSLRIFPVYYAFLLPFLFVPKLFTGIGRWWFLLYLRNFRGPDQASDGLLGHLWSLAVEEQFYILWSVAVFLIGRTRLPKVTIGLIALGPVIRALLHHYGFSGYMVIRLTPARMDSLLWGALVALIVRSTYKTQLRHFGQIGLAVSLVGLVVTRVLQGPLNIDNSVYQVVVPSLSPMLYASILCLCLAMRHGHPAYSFLVNPFFRIVAKYSYAIYLFHLVVGRRLYILIPALVHRYPNSNGFLHAAFLPVAFAAVLGAAALSWRIIEQPALRQKDRFFSA